MIPLRKGVTAPHLRTRAPCLLLLFTNLAMAAPADATFECRPVTQSLHWVESVRLNPNRATVQIKLLGDPQHYTVPMLHMSESASDESVYAFNWKVPTGEQTIVNSFKLFRAMGEWRLIDVGLEERAGTLVLRALGDSQPMNCKGPGS